MPLDINKFFSSFTKSELARPSKFDVIFTIPDAVRIGDEKNPYYISNLDLALRCETAQLPSRTLMTTEQKIYGITEKYPYENSYTDAEFTFYVSGNMKEKILFDRWLDYVSPRRSYHMNYKNNYQTTIKVTQYDLQNKEQYKIYLRKAFPLTVNQLDLDWSSDSVHKLTVVFAYSDWYMEAMVA